MSDCKDLEKEQKWKELEEKLARYYASKAAEGQEEEHDFTHCARFAAGDIHVQKYNGREYEMQTGEDGSTTYIPQHSQLEDIETE